MCGKLFAIDCFGAISFLRSWSGVWSGREVTVRAAAWKAASSPAMSGPVGW